MKEVVFGVVEMGMEAVEEEVVEDELEVAIQNI